jgi:hypothetical protein
MLFCLYFFFSFFFLDLGGGWQAGALILGYKISPATSGVVSLCLNILNGLSYQHPRFIYYIQHSNFKKNNPFSLTEITCASPQACGAQRYWDENE